MLRSKHYDKSKFASTDTARSILPEAKQDFRILLPLHALRVRKLSVINLHLNPAAQERVTRKPLYNAIYASDES